MKKILIYFFVAFFPIIIYSQEESVFWKIEKDSINSYLLGTQHLFGKSYISQNEIILDKIKDSNLILIENIDSLDSIVNLRPSNSFIDYLTEEQKIVLNNLFFQKIDIEKLTLKECLLQTDKFWAKISCLKRKEFKDSISMDSYLKKLSYMHKIKLVGLENLSETLNYINNYTYNDFENEKLKRILNSKLNNIIKNVKHNHCEIEEQYRDKKYFYNFDKMIDSPIIKDRNENWMKQIPNLLEKNKNIFIGIGIAHLDYKNGIINLLREKGYSVTPIKL